MNNVKRYVAGILATIAIIPTFTFYVGAFKFRESERYVVGSVADVSSYNVKANIRSSGGFVESVNGDLVVVSNTDGTMQLSYQITDTIKNLNELSNTDWGYYIILDNISDNFKIKDRVSGNIAVVDNMFAVYYKAGEYNTYSLAQASFTRKDKNDNSDIIITTEDDKTITVYGSKSYTQLKSENEALSNQATKDDEYIKSLEKEIENLQKQVEYLSIKVNNNEGFAYDVNGDGNSDLKDAVLVMMYVVNNSANQ